MFFTPINNKTGKRLKLNIETTFIPRGKVTTFWVVEKKTNIAYECKTMSCGLPNCICDAKIFDYITKRKD